MASFSRLIGTMAKGASPRSILPVVCQASPSRTSRTIRPSFIKPWARPATTKTASSSRWNATGLSRRTSTDCRPLGCQVTPPPNSPRLSPTSRPPARFRTSGERTSAAGRMRRSAPTSWTCHESREKFAHCQSRSVAGGSTSLQPCGSCCAWATVLKTSRASYLTSNRLQPNTQRAKLPLLRRGDAALERRAHFAGLLDDFADAAIGAREQRVVGRGRDARADHLARLHCIALRVIVADVVLLRLVAGVVEDDDEERQGELLRRAGAADPGGGMGRAPAAGDS